MKSKALFLSALLTLPALSFAAELNLSAWLNHYPSDKIKGKTADEVWLQKKLLPASEVKLLKSFINEDVVSSQSNHTVVFKCRPHACSGSYAMIFQNAAGDIWIGIYESNDKVDSTRWYGSKDYLELPSALQTLFTKSHVLN